MGEVFLAEDMILTRRVALKFLTVGDHTAEGESMLREARSAASLDHPAVCKVFETGEFEGRPFIVMEFIDGETLSRRLKAGPVPFREALQIMIDLSEALAEAHAKGIVHCDLKPSNIMIARGGHVKLMDFGLARPFHRSVLEGGDSSASATMTLTLNRHVAGTIDYMAPEQARAEILDARVDVFALGIILFEMLAGAHPFRKNTSEATIGAILYEETPDIRKYSAGARPELIRLLRRALAKKAEDRYASAGEFAADLAIVRDEEKAQLAPPAVPTVAILPFRDLSPRSDQEYFCDGLAEELIVALGRIGKLRVMARSATFRYRNPEISLQEIGQALRATMILEGSVRKSGDRLRIVLNLVDVENGWPVWCEKYDGRLDDVFEVQEEIARAVAEKLKVTFDSDGAERLTHAGTRNILAYESFLKGRYFWNKRTPDNLKLSIGQFESALADDPEYALAWAGIADSWVTLSILGAAKPIEVMPTARAAADRALELSPRLPEALMTRACIRAVFDWDWNGAESEFRNAIRLNPRSAQAHQWYAMHCLIPRRDFEQAKNELKLAAELEPLSLAIATSLGVLDFLQGHPDSAIRRFRAVLELDEGFYLAHYFLGQACCEKQMHDESIRELERAVAISRGSSESLSALGYAQAVAGNHAEGIQMLNRLTAREADSYVSPVLLAQIETGLGQIEPALKNLRKAVEVRATDLIWLNVRPAFAGLRSHEGLAEIAAAVGLVSDPSQSSPATRSAWGT